MSDPDSFWKRTRHGAMFVSPKYLYGAEFVCDRGRIVGYGMETPDVRRAARRRRR
jgi:hypothetical protein